MNAPLDVSRWSVDRRTFIGGSEIAAVCGLHPTRTALDVWGNKVHGYERKVGPEAEVGLEYEEPTARLYARRMGVIEPMEMRGTLVDPANPWAGATPDRLRLMPDGSCINVQVKVVGEHMTRRWGKPEDGVSAIPLDIFAQVTWEARAIEAATGMRVDLSHVPTNLGGTNIVTFLAPYDREFSALLFETAREWWRRYVVGREMPEITEANASAARALLAHMHPRETLPMVECSSEHVAAAHAYDAARTAAKVADAGKDEAAAKLIALVGDAEGFESDDGLVRVTHKATKKGNRSLLVTIREV